MAEPTPASFRRYSTLGIGAFGTMLDVALVVIGSIFLGLTAAVVLDGFGLVRIGLGLSTGAMLGSALVIGILGGFALGVASEGPLGRGRSLVGFTETEVLVARVVSVMVVGTLLVLLERYARGIVAELPFPFGVAASALRAVGLAALTAVPFVAIPLAWWARSGGLGDTLAADADIPLMYFVWAVATMILL